MLSSSLLFFFFSSRRRHTRSLCDWSSDVCSSDLLQKQDAGGPSTVLRLVDNAEISAAAEKLVRRLELSGLRSEERRVGKECRSRWWAHHYKKNGERETVETR